MNCLPRVFSLVGSFLLVLLLSSSFATQVRADYLSVSLSPATGVLYSDSTAISVYVNSGSEEFTGVDLNLGFTGSVQYLSAIGAARCSSFKVTPGTGTINIECLSTAHETGETYSGVIATLYFKSSGTGTSVFSFSSTDPNIVTKTGGTYTLTTETNPNAVDDGNKGLPESGIFDDSRSVLVLGGILILVGIFFNQISNGIMSLSSKTKEAKINKRRDKLEGRF